MANLTGQNIPKRRHRPDRFAGGSWQAWWADRSRQTRPQPAPDFASSRCTRIVGMLRCARPSRWACSRRSAWSPRWSRSAPRLRWWPGCRSSCARSHAESRWLAIDRPLWSWVSRTWASDSPYLEDSFKSIEDSFRQLEFLYFCM